MDNKRVAREFEEVESIYGKFFTIKNDLVSKQLKEFSAHQRNDIAMLLSFIREGDIILDIGSHIGTFAIPIAQSFNGNVEIFAFEPQPEIYELLRKNVEINLLDQTIKTFNGIVSEQEENFKFTINIRNNSMASQFLPFKNNQIDEHQKQPNLTVYIIDEMVKKQIIPDQVNLIKIDTEGAELKVLQSCSNLIDKNPPIIYGEINDNALKNFNTSSSEIEKFLLSQGYHFFCNIGERNSMNDSFSLARLKHLIDGGPFFDFLAIHPNSNRYPQVFRFYNYFSTKKRLLRKVKNSLIIVKKLLKKLLKK